MTEEIKQTILAALDAYRSTSSRGKCLFCGDLGKELDDNGHCRTCIEGMASTNGD